MSVNRYDKCWVNIFEEGVRDDNEVGPHSIVCMFVEWQR